MTIEIHQPEVEALLRQRMQTGQFEDIEDVILHALRTSQAEAHVPVPKCKTLEEVFTAVRGLADDLDFSRNPSRGRQLEL